MITIPTVTSGDVYQYEQIVPLEGVPYRIRLAWNTRTEHWYLSLWEVDGTEVVLGRAVVLWTDLLRGVVASGRPAGRLFSFPTDGVQRHAGLTELGTRVQLVYQTATEAAADG